MVCYLKSDGGIRDRRHVWSLSPLNQSLGLAPLKHRFRSSNKIAQAKLCWVVRQSESDALGIKGLEIRLAPPLPSHKFKRDHVSAICDGCHGSPCPVMANHATSRARTPISYSGDGHEKEVDPWRYRGLACELVRARRCRSNNPRLRFTRY